MITCEFITGLGTFPTHRFFASNGLLKKKCGAPATSAKKLKWYLNLCPDHWKKIWENLEKMHREAKR